MSSSIQLPEASDRGPARRNSAAATMPFVIVAFYLLDSILSLLLPVSRGIFVLLIVPYLFMHADFRRYRPARWPIVAGFATLAVAGAIGAVLSGTGLTPIFAFSVLLMFVLWSGGASLNVRRVLITPGAALVGVILALLFLLLSLAGFDLYGVLRGVESNRGAGLFLEPSHFGLYVTPLWLIAYQRRSFRLPLYAMLLLAAATLFSLTLAASLIVALAVSIALRAPSSRVLAKDSLKFLVIVGAVVAVIVALDDAIVIEDRTLSTYLGERFTGLLATGEEDYVSLSSLAVLQGIEIASESVVASRGFGVGLGNLGVNDAINDASIYRRVINRLTGDDLDLNLRDGGLLLNKLTGELGIFALGVAALLVLQFRRLRALPRGVMRHYHYAMFAFIVTEIFVRGLPYFSAPSCLAIISMAALLHRPRRSKRRKPRRAGRPVAHPLAPTAQLTAGS